MPLNAKVVPVVPLIVPAQAHGRSVRVQVMDTDVFAVVVGSILPAFDAHTSVLMHNAPLGDLAHATATEAAEAPHDEEVPEPCHSRHSCVMAFVMAPLPHGIAGALVGILVGTLVGVVVGTRVGTAVGLAASVSVGVVVDLLGLKYISV